MCNHYRKKPEVAEWTRRTIPGLAIPQTLPDFPEHTYPKYAAPIVLRESGANSLVAMSWGVLRFIGEGKTKPVTNSRSDKLLSRTWKTCALTRRCLIPATGYYEPGLGPVGAKGEILFTVKERPMFFFAGLWDTNPDGRAFSMVTTEPNEFVARFHDRMPVVLSDTDALAWLGDEPLPDEHLLSLCTGIPAEALHHEELAPKLKIIRPVRKPAADAGPELF